mmetsp:Transcript_38763/g.91524  ORF Transcript_38763/g.91524 Transcript_38763/m.91524 type:complete len:258 (-) Transcript_38763:1089-1862(-)
MVFLLSAHSCNQLVPNFIAMSISVSPARTLYMHLGTRNSKQSGADAAPPSCATKHRLPEEPPAFASGSHVRFRITCSSALDSSSTRSVNIAPGGSGPSARMSMLTARRSAASRAMLNRWPMLHSSGTPAGRPARCGGSEAASVGGLSGSTTKSRQYCGELSAGSTPTLTACTHTTAQPCCSADGVQEKFASYPGTPLYMAMTTGPSCAPAGSELLSSCKSQLPEGGGEPGTVKRRRKESGNEATSSLVAGSGRRVGG